MFKSIRNTLIGIGLTVATTSASALPITFDFSGSGHRLLGYSQTFSQSGLDVKAQALGGGRLSQVGSGLGVGGTHWLDTSQLDGLGPDESILFRFSRSVRLLGFTLARIGHNDEVALTVDGTSRLSGNIPGNNRYGSGVGTISTDLSGTDFRFGVTDYDDDYYINSLTVNGAEVPEPGTIALFAVGLVGLGMARRRAKTIV